MSHHWLIVIISWIGSASLQYINTGGPGADTVFDTPDSLQQPLTYTNYFNLPASGNEYENIPDISTDQFYPQEEVRKRRYIDNDDSQESQWDPNHIDTDKTLYLSSQDQAGPFIIELLGTGDNAIKAAQTKKGKFSPWGGKREVSIDHKWDKNPYLSSQDQASPFIIQLLGTGDNATKEAPTKKEKFSPWGGKREVSMEHMWTWKRGSMREPRMPKHVRFSPWGGKRSGNMIFKPGFKTTKVIFSASIPELTGIVSNSPTQHRVSLSEFQFIPSIDKRHPIKILALSTNVDERTLRDALPFKNFIDSLPKIYKPGHPYLDRNLKKDGKRKVKFSAWGGKRSPPIIGPIWNPAHEEVKD